MSATTSPGKKLVHGIDLAAPGGVARLLEWRRARHGELTMTGPTPPTPPPTPPAPPAPSGPERPEGISETEWAALGDPGKGALVREREARKALEQQLAAARATPPAPPKPVEPPKPSDIPKGPDGQPDVAAIVQQAVAAALQPFQEREAHREAAQAAEKVRDAVVTAASERFHDASDALAQVDLTTLIDASGKADDAKIKTALDELLAKKPHLGKAVDTRRRAADGSLIGSTPGGANLSMEDRVKEQLALMNRV